MQSGGRLGSVRRLIPPTHSINDVNLAGCVRDVARRLRLAPSPQTGSATYRLVVRFATPDGEPYVPLPERGLQP